jgi:hypothetical protein
MDLVRDVDVAASGIARLRERLVHLDIISL